MSYRANELNASFQISKVVQAKKSRHLGEVDWHPSYMKHLHLTFPDSIKDVHNLSSFCLHGMDKHVEVCSGVCMPWLWETLGSMEWSSKRLIWIQLPVWRTTPPDQTFLEGFQSSCTIWTRTWVQLGSIGVLSLLSYCRVHRNNQRPEEEILTKYVFLFLQ